MHTRHCFRKLTTISATEVHQNSWLMGFPGGSDGKESACNGGELGFILGLERSLKDPLVEGMATHSSILAWRIPVDRGAWWATVHGVAQLDTTERLSTELMVAGV